jgi:hypothetical protein
MNLFVEATFVAGIQFVEEEEWTAAKRLVEVGSLLVEVEIPVVAVVGIPSAEIVEAEAEAEVETQFAEVAGLEIPKAVVGIGMQSVQSWQDQYDVRRDKVVVVSGVIVY